MRSIGFRIVATVIVLLAWGCATARLDRGVVVAPEPLAAEVGAQVLRQGGNAVDAAVAVAFVLAVTFPNAGNLGGGGFMLVHTERGESAIDYRETSPGAATRDMFLDPSGNPVPGLSLTSHKASGVPGTVAGLWKAHRMFGSRPWRELVEPALRLAQADTVYDPRVPPERQRELAVTLGRIVRDGRDGFYRGETARLIAQEMKRGGGLITEADLARYEARTRDPVAGTYRGFRVVSMPPPSSGGAILIQLLNMMECFEPGRLGHNSTGYVNVLCELEKRAFADRATWLGDGDFVDVPLAGLTSKPYARRRIEGVAADRRTIPERVREGAAREAEQTTHFSIVDRNGNAVANTYTLNDSYGSGIFVGGAGFLLNNEMDDFSVKPGVPNMYGVVGGVANAIAPDKRMLSSMSPTFVFKPDGALWLVAGTPGGPTIITSVLQVILNRIDYGMPIDRAVAAPRFHHQWPPPARDRDVIECEHGIDATGLARLGYVIERRAIGDVQAIEIDRAARRAIGAPDPRHRGAAAHE